MYRSALRELKRDACALKLIFYRREDLCDKPRDGESRFMRGMGSKERKRMHAVLFDLDGTILNSTFKAKEAKTAVIERVTELGLDTRSISIDDTVQSMLEKAEAQVTKGGRLSRESLRKNLNTVLDRFDVEALFESELTKGATHVICELKKSGVKVGLVSNSGSRGVKLALKKFGLDGIFDVVITRDDVKRIKPTGDCIRKALSTLGYRPNDAAYVGDSWIDVMAAQDAGVMAIAIVGGISPKERLLQASPDKIIYSLDELLNIV
jgi:HAD superfamily hydrolase (TIGR01549 family)